MESLDNFQELKENKSQKTPKSKPNEESKTPSQSSQSIVSSLINMTSGGPQCSITLNCDKGYFQNNDDISGTVTITSPVDG